MNKCSSFPICASFYPFSSFIDKLNEFSWVPLRIMNVLLGHFAKISSAAFRLKLGNHHPFCAHALFFPSNELDRCRFVIVCKSCKILTHQFRFTSKGVGLLRGHSQFCQISEKGVHLGRYLDP